MAIRLLVVDDEPDLATLIKQKFRRQVRGGEFEFFFALDGVEALEVLTAHPDIDIAITDINMPNMNGLTLLSEIRKLQRPLLKTLIVSAYDDMGNIRTAMNRGAYDFLTKPIDLQDLELTISKTHEELIMMKAALDASYQLIALRQELDIARRIQQSILPSTFPGFPEKRPFDIDAEMITAREVGGDFYDFYAVDDHRLAFTIGDVSGKGIPAAILMAMTRTLLKTTALREVNVHECITHVNRILAQETDSAMFVTLFYGVIDTRNGQIECCNAGHNPPFMLQKDGTVEEALPADGIPLGFMAGYQYRSTTIQLPPGASLFLYTDGISEAMDSGENEFSEARLAASLAKNTAAPLQDILQEVVKDVRAFTQGHPQSDDITMLILRYPG